MLSAVAATKSLARFGRDLESLAVFPIGDVAPDLARSSAEEIAVARKAWNARVADEYRSVHAFTELLARLARICPAYEVLACVQRLIGDELRHTRLCLSLAARFGVTENISTEIGFDLGSLDLVANDDANGSRALEIVSRELVVAEGESIVQFRALMETTTDPAVARVFELLVREEGRHYAAGLALEAWLLHHVPVELLEPFASRREGIMAEDRKKLRDHYRRGAHGGLGERFGGVTTRAAIDRARRHHENGEPDAYFK